MTDDVTTSMPSADARATQPAPADVAVGDVVRGRPVFGVRKVEGAVFVAFDAECAWQPL